MELLICVLYFCHRRVIHLLLRMENALSIRQTGTFHGQQRSDSGGVNL